MAFIKLQQAVSDLVAQDNSSVADYLVLSKQLLACTDNPPDYFRKVRAAFLSNFTLLGLPEVFRVRALFHNIWVDTYLGPYNQYAQEILNSESGFYKFQPELVYFLVDQAGSDENQINEMVGNLSAKGFRVKLIWGSAIKEKFPDHWNTKYKELGDLRLAPDAFPDFVERELIGEAVAVSGAAKKCLVTDLDNTLWQGIVGESDYNEIEPETDLQKHILDLYGRGVVLAVNSKNNHEDSILIMDKHPDMVLRPDHFAALKINWRDKADNMAELATELNLGLDSFVFIDDDPFQRASVKNRFPEVAVLHPDKLKDYPGFSSLTLTEEDRRRGQMYAEENRRKGLQASLGSVDDFLRELDLKIEIAPVNSDSLARASQLTQKTNQFNLTTRRYSESEIENFRAKGWLVWTVKAADRFGDYGIIGVGMVEPKGGTWRVDNFLLSCRILGRGVEKAFLGYLLSQAKSVGVSKVLGEFIPTAKNEPCQNFYPDNSFDLIEKGDRVFSYKYSLDEDYQVPDFIKFVAA